MISNTAADAGSSGAGVSGAAAVQRAAPVHAARGPDGVVARAVDVTRTYGKVVALDRVRLDIGGGELLGLLGPNGAGKSTLVNLFVGLRRPTAGRVEVFGGNPRDPSHRRQIGMTPQETGLPATLRVKECVEFVGRHFPAPVPVGDLLDRFGLGGLERRQTGGLSGGQKRRLAVALAFVGRPRLVFLDEPSTGLDVEARRGLWEGIRAFHETGGTVVLTSHYLEEVEALASRVVVVDDGRVRADGDVEAIRRLVAVRRVSVTAASLPDLPGVRSVERDGDRHHLLTTDSDQLVRDLVRSEAAFAELEVRATSLEDAFLSLTATGGHRDGGDGPGDGSSRDGTVTGDGTATGDATVLASGVADGGHSGTPKTPAVPQPTVPVADH